MRFKALDGLRGLAALCVTLFHIQLLSKNLIGHLPINFVLNSFLFVDFFFVLSGFVIAAAYQNRLHSSGDLVVFGLRRFFRLWPMHASMLLALVMIETVRAQFFIGGPGATGAPFGAGEQSATIIANLLLIHSLGIFPSTTWNVPSWSISAEFYTYALFALTCMAPPRIRPLAWFSCAALGSIVLVRNATNFLDTTFDFGFFRCLFGFFTGALVWQTFVWSREAVATRPWLGAASAVTLAAAIGFVATVDNSAVTYGAPLLFGAVVYLFAFARGPVAWLLMTKPANWFGKLSYSIYMVQWIVLIGAGLCMHLLQRLKLIPSDMNVFSTASPLVGDLFVLFYLTTICAIAALTHCLVERPPQRWFERHLQSRGGFAFASAEAAPTPAPTPGVESLNRPIDLSTYETELACRIPPLPHM